MFDDKVYTVEVDKCSCFCTESGDLMFFSSVDDYKQYISDKLGKDFSECIKCNEDSGISKLYELYDEISFYNDRTDFSEIKSPVLHQKKCKELLRLLQKCAGTLENYFMSIE